MAKRKSNRGPAPRAQSSSNARRLGGPQNRPGVSAGSQRRTRTRARRRSNTPAVIAIAVVIIVVVLFIGIRLGGSSTPTSNTPDTTGQHPALASLTEMVQPVATVPAAVYNSIGTAGEPATMQPLKNQKELKTGSLPRFVYEGAEYCPYCAMARWSMVAALSRFGTFSSLKMTSSATATATSSPSASSSRRTRRST